MGSELTSSQTCEILQSIDLVRSEVRRLHEMDRLIAAGGNIYEMYSKLYRLVAVRYRLEQPAPETRPVPDDRWIKHSEETPAEPPRPGCEEWWHLKQYGYVPGGYIITCFDCKEKAWDCDKRASICRPCAEKRHSAANR